ncbi:MAG: peptidylprolyl isomerase [Ferruginibacter sp.]
MKKFVIIITAMAFTSLFCGCNHTEYKNPHIMIVTSDGDIEAELYPDKAPKTVAAFLSYIDSGFYTNSSFYRIVYAEGLTTALNTGLIQGGIYLTNEKDHPNVAGIVHEGTRQTGLSHVNGTLSLARTDPGTASTEFFICIGDQTQFDYGNSSRPDSLGFAAFGEVLSGMDVVRKIQLSKKNGESITEKVTIKKIKRL